MIVKLIKTHLKPTQVNLFDMYFEQDLTVMSVNDISVKLNVTEQFIFKTIMPCCPEVFYRITILRVLSNFTGKHLRWNPVFRKACNVT